MGPKYSYGGWGLNIHTTPIFFGNPPLPLDSGMGMHQNGRDMCHNGAVRPLRNWDHHAALLHAAQQRVAPPFAAFTAAMREGMEA